MSFLAIDMVEATVPPPLCVLPPCKANEWLICPRSDRALLFLSIGRKFPKPLQEAYETTVKP
jgi:hypothetical protein